ncbi:MAG: hypothetical protein E7507_08175 [Ruminococcus sp.]|nr:hypothetical protein [Ruminococcus sp.]
MDELTFKPTPVPDENNKPEKKEKPSFEMDMIDFAPKKKETVDETEAFFEESKTESLEDIIKKEKMERQRLKEEQNKAQPLPEAAPQPPKDNGIIELTLTPPPTTPPSMEKPVAKKAEPSEEKAPEPKAEEKATEVKAEEKLPEVKSEEKAEAPKPKKKKSTKPKAPAGETAKGDTKPDNKKKAEAPSPKKEEKPEEKAESIDEIIPKKKIEIIPEADPDTPVEIEELVIPSDLKAPEKEEKKPEKSFKDADSIESLAVSVPVFKEVDETTAQQHDESIEDEYQKLVKLEDIDSLTPDDKRRLQIIRLIDLKKKGTLTKMANDNLVSFMNEERRLGHDVSAFEKALSELSQPAKSVSSDLMNAPSTQKPASAPTKDVLPSFKADNQVHNAEPAPTKQPAKTEAPIVTPSSSKNNDAEKAPAKSEGGSIIDKILENKIIIGIAALALAIIIIIVAAVSCNSGNDKPAETTTVTTTVAEETTTTQDNSVIVPEETTVAETEKISAGNMIEATVEEVIDADTIKADIDGEEYTIQLIGVEAPASWAYWGPDSTTYAKKKLLDQHITLEFDKVLYVDEEDKTTLYAYIWHDNGKTLFNDELVILGHVKASPTEGNSKYDAEFDRTQTEAKNKKLGLWSYKPVTSTRPTVNPTGTAAKYPYIADDRNHFHKNDCAYAYDGGTKFYFSTREEAKAYAPNPCPTCNP